MRDHLRPVHLFGRNYFWRAERGQPLQLVRAVPWPGPLPADPVMRDVMARMLGGPLPWPKELPVSGYPTPEQRKAMEGVGPGAPPSGPAGASSANPTPEEETDA